MPKKLCARCGGPSEALVCGWCMGEKPGKNPGATRQPSHVETVGDADFAAYNASVKHFHHQLGIMLVQLTNQMRDAGMKFLDHAAVKGLLARGIFIMKATDTSLDTAVMLFRETWSEVEVTVKANDQDTPRS